MKLSLLPLWLVVLTALGSARAEVKFNGAFSDHMVLQRGAGTPVWGTAAPGETVTVTVDERQAAAKADESGQWRAELGGLKPGGPFDLKAVGTSTANAIEVKDVLVGDVWLCSGQSNMAFTMKSLANSRYASDLAAANFPTLRQGTVPRKPSLAPVESADVKWTACTPETVGDFTAAGFYFARNVQKEIGVPVGLILSAWGGTSAESWVSKEALDTVPDFKTRADEQIENLRKLPDATKNFPALLAAWEQKYGRVDPGNEGEKNGWAAPDAGAADWKPGKLNQKWRDAGLPNGGIAWVRKEVTLPASAAGKEFRLDLGAVDEQYTTAYFNGEKLGESGRKSPEFYSGYVGYKVPGRLVRAGKNVLAIRFVADTGDKSPLTRKADGLGFLAVGLADPGDDCLIKIERQFTPLSHEALAERPAAPKGDAAHTSSSLYGGMIRPLIPFAIKGVLWYQGEQDGSRGHAYRTLLPLLIRDWRTRWGQGDFPFLVQQLPNWNASGAQAIEWAELREAQAMTAKSVPNCYLAVGIDVGEAANVHPQNKREVGRRLALLALAHVYGQPVECSGPVYDSMTTESSAEGSAIRLKFANAKGLKTSDGGPLKQFLIAADDKKFFPAEAKIEGETVLVSSDRVKAPEFVRYAFINNPEGCNLTNASGLPAAPFRTDAWPAEPENRK